MENNTFSQLRVKSLKFRQTNGIVIGQMKQTKAGVSYASQPIKRAI